MTTMPLAGLRATCGIVLALAVAGPSAVADQGEDAGIVHYAHPTFRWLNTRHDDWSRWWFANRAELLRPSYRDGPAQAPAPPAIAAARDRSRQALLSALDAKEHMVAAQAALALGRCGDPRDGAALARVVTDGRELAHRHLHRMAALGLGCIGPGTPEEDAAVRAALLEGVESSRGNADDSIYFWTNCAYALAMRGDRAVVPDLVRVRERALAAGSAVRGVHAVVLGGVCYALGDLGGDLTLPEVEDHLTGRRSPDRGSTDTSWEAAHALARIGGDRARTVLLAATRDDRENVRRSALLALGAVAGPADDDAARRLAEALADDDDGCARGMAAIALGRSGHADALPALTSAMGAPLAADRAFAALGLGLWARRRHDDRAAAVLEKALLGATAEDDQRPLVIACGLAGAAGARARIAELARESAVGPLAAFASCALGLLGPHDDSSAVLREVLARSGDPGTRREAALALGMIRDPEVVPRLRALAEDAGTDLDRCGAMVSLGSVGGPADADLLVSILRSRRASDQLRAAAAWALGHLFDRHGAPRLGRVAADAMWWIDRNERLPIHDVQWFGD